MAVTRHYLRNTQTVSGTGGTIYDLSTTQGSPATLVSASISSTTFTKIFEWRFAVGTALPQSSVPVSISISAVSASTLLCRWRLSRYNSSNVLQSSSSYSAEHNTTGTKTETLSLAASWTAGDFFAIEVELRRNGGSGGRTVTLNVNNASSYVDPDLVEPIPDGSGTGALEVAATGVGVSTRYGSGVAALAAGAVGIGESQRYGNSDGALSLAAVGDGQAPGSDVSEGSGIAALDLGVVSLGRRGVFRMRAGTLFNVRW